MATAADHFVSFGKEVTFGTAVTPSRTLPFVDGTEGDFDVMWREGKGVAGGNGRRAQVASRAFITNGKGVVKTRIEAESRAMGYVLDMAIGVTQGPTVITGGSQMNFHPGLTGMVLPSATIQIQKVRNDGTAFLETYRGCTASKVTFEQPEDDIAFWDIEWDALAVSTVTGAITPTYVLTDVLFDAIQATTFYGGAFTAPTTTALASVATASTVWRAFKVEIDQKINDDGWVLTASIPRSQPKAGTPEIKVSGTVEFNDAVIASNYLAGTKAPFACTWTTTETLGAGFSQLQIAIPSLALSKGLPQVKPGEAPTTFGIEGKAYNDGTNRDFYAILRTLDTVL